MLQQPIIIKSKSKEYAMVNYFENPEEYDDQRYAYFEEEIEQGLILIAEQAVIENWPCENRMCESIQCDRLTEIECEIDDIEKLTDIEREAF